MRTFLATFVLFTACTAAFARPAPPEIEANAYLLVDFDSGAVLAARDPNKSVEPASLTKIMTSYVVFGELAKGELQLSDEVTVSEKAWKTGGSRMFIEVGKQVKVEDLLRGLIIQSGNDASVALAEHVAGTESAFADMMNRAASRIGLKDSYFRNATGLPAEGHIVSARDMATLAAALIRDFPKRYSWYSEKAFRFNNITQHNRNKLLWRDDSVDGIKTGHTEAAGYCLVSSAIRDNRRLIAVVVGTESEKARADASQALLNWGYRFTETHAVYQAKEALNEMPLWKGAADSVTVGPAEAVHVTVPRGRYPELKAELLLDDPVLAPITAGQPVGEIKITLGDETLASVPAVAFEAVAEAGMVGRLIDSIRLAFH